MLIIAERINSSRKGLPRPSGRGPGLHPGRGQGETQAGAHYIDVNAGTFVGEEAEKLKWIVEAVQEVTDLPLSIDSPDPEVIKAMLPLVKKTADHQFHHPGTLRIEGILPLVVANKTKVIALCQAEHGWPRRRKPR